MATTDLYGKYTNPATPEILGLERQREYARQLMQMSAQPQGGMVSGRYVAPAFTQQLQAALNPVIGALMSTSADKRALQIAEKLRQEQEQIGSEFFQNIQGKPAVYGPDIPTETYETVKGEMISPATGPDYAKALKIASNTNAPAFARNYMNELLKPRVLKEGETLQLPSLVGGQFNLSPMGGGGVTLPSDLKSVAIRLGLPLDSSKWTDQQRKLADAAVKEEKKLTGTTVNIPNFTEKTFAGELAGNQAKRFDTLQSTAEKAPDTLRAVQQNRAILQSGKFFSGSPANVQLELAKMADAFGLGGTDTKTKAANSQTLITNAASATLDSISGSGLGAGQGFTDKDLKFLQDAKSFRITMTDENIRRILDLQERAARQAVIRYNDRLKTLPQASVQVMGLRPIELPVENVRDRADAIIKGQ